MDKLVITYSSRRRVRKKKLAQVPTDKEQSKKVCQFCLSDIDCEINYGAILEKEDVMVHYFCMLLSSGLCQNAKVSDKKSILGFTLFDIKKELQRGSRLKCCFCHNKGATIGCCVKACRKVFHLSCGRQHGTMHQFFDSFRSYCENHRLEQNMPKKKSHQCSSAKTCSICLFAVTSFDSCDTLMPPCCQKSLFHRQCIQQYALSAGMHYFKCPLCNSVEEFQMEMRLYGIYIPDQDASWEREPNAFQELLERHHRCDASECLCPRGRQFDAATGKYALMLCGWCGAYGSHKTCSGLVWRGVHLVCYDCAEIIDKVDNKQKQEKRNLDSKQEKLMLHRPRTANQPRKRHLPQEELNEKLPTSSATRRLKESLQNNSVMPERKKQCLNNLQFPLPAQLHEESNSSCSVQKRSSFFPDSAWRLALIRNQQEPKSLSVSPSRQQSSKSNLREERQSPSGWKRSIPKCSEVTTVCISNTAKWDTHLFDCRIVLTKIDREISNILKKIPHNFQSEGSYTSLKPCSGQKSSSSFTIQNGFGGTTEQNLVSEVLSANEISTAQAHSSTERSLPDLIHVHDDYSKLSEGIFSQRSPPVIMPGTCSAISPQKPKQRKSYWISISEQKTDNVDEILIEETAYIDLACGDEVQSTTNGSQLEKVVDSCVYSTTSASEHGIIKLTRWPEPVCNSKPKIVVIKFQTQQFCEVIAQDKANIQKIINQDPKITLCSSVLSYSHSVIPRVENCSEHSQYPNSEIRIKNQDSAHTNKLHIQTDIFGKILMLDSKHMRRRRIPKSKDSTALLKLSQSKIENFFITQSH